MQPDRRTAPTAPRMYCLACIRSISLRVCKFDAAILRIGSFIAPLHRRPFFAVADGRDLRFADALEHQRTAHGLRAALTEADVVLARTALVRVSFEANLASPVPGEVLGVRRDDRQVLLLDLRLVVV